MAVASFIFLCVKHSDNSHTFIFCSNCVSYKVTRMRYCPGWRNSQKVGFSELVGTWGWPCKLRKNLRAVGFLKTLVHNYYVYNYIMLCDLIPPPTLSLVKESPLSWVPMGIKCKLHQSESFITRGHAISFRVLLKTLSVDARWKDAFCCAVWMKSGLMHSKHFWA